MHTYTTAGARTVTLSVSDGQATDQATRQVSPALPVGGPGHTVEVSDTVRTNMPRITAGEIFDLEYIGDRVYVVGGFTSIRNNAGNNTTSYNQPYLAAFNLQTGLVDAGFRPTFDGGVTKRKFASINPTTGATVAGFTAHANGAGTELEATNTTVYLGGQFTQINGADKVGLAAVDANTGALIGRSGANPCGTSNNDISGGIGPNGALNVQELKITPDQSKLLVVHTGRQIAGQDRYGVGLINLTTGQLLPWRTACGRTTSRSSVASSASTPATSPRTASTSWSAAGPVATGRRSTTRRSPSPSTATTSSSRCGCRGCSTASTRWRSPRSGSTSVAT